MVLKNRVILALSSLCIVSSCSSPNEPQIKRSQKRAQTQTEPQETISRSDAYLLDAVDAAAQEAAPANVAVTATVTADIGETSIKKTTSRLFEIADADKSGSISLEEFLTTPQILRRIHKKHMGVEPTEEQKTKMKERLTADFQEFAGADAQMSDDELRSLMMYYAPRVSHHREKGRGCKHHQDGVDRPDGEDDGEGRPTPPSWEELIKKYDKNADGMLNKEEFEAMRADRHHPRPE